MKKAAFSVALLLAVFLVVNAYSAEQVRVEVLYMNHGPLRDTIAKMKKVFSSYGSRISVSWHDFNTEEGEQFMAKKGIRQHVPLVIWINGKTKATVGNREMTFSGFPTGSGPAFFQGKWTIDDLNTALAQVAAKK